MDIDELPEGDRGLAAGADAGPAPVGADCRNCGAPLLGRFCAACGQSSATLRVSLREVVANAASDLWSLDSRILTTARALVWPPGEITRQYLDGRRARFVPAFRLYLICSLLFFLILSFTGLLRPEVRTTQDPESVAAMGEVRTDLVSQAEATEGLERAFLLQVERFLALQEGEEDVATAIGRMIERNLPKVMFFLLPLFALLLRLLYLRREWVYAEHIVFSLHYHALTFALFATALLAGRWIPGWIVLPLVALYLPLSMRRIYRQGWVRTLLKSAVLGLLYFLICATAIGLLLGWAFFAA